MPCILVPGGSVVHYDELAEGLARLANALLRAGCVPATTWNFELAARSALTRQGWTGKSVKIGDTVTVEGDLARSGVTGGHARTVVLADGTKVFSGANDNN